MQLRKFVISIMVVMLVFSGIGDLGGLFKSEVSLVSEVSANAKTQLKKEKVEFIRVVDGDTIKVRYKGKEESVRYLLIDTPETSNTKTKIQKYGPEAKKRNEQLLKRKNQPVYIQFDKGEKRDKYGRLLAYVYSGNTDIQDTLIKEGLGRVAYVYKPSITNLKQYEKSEEQAKKKKLGIWSIPGYVTKSGFKEIAKKPAPKKKAVAKKPAPKKKTVAKKPAPKKKVVAKKPAPKSNVIKFKNCTELRKVYPKGVPRSHKSYEAKHDRDKDGWACE